MAIDVVVNNAVAKVVFNRPEKLNALTLDMREALARKFAELQYDSEVRAIIITGSGKAFCTGADVEGMDKADLRGARERVQRGVQTLITALRSVEKPVIAAVNGHAVGLGWSIALACDVIIAAQSARFAQIFRKVGLVPDGGACWFLARLIGPARAKELIFSARMVDADEALALGLVNHVVADDQLLTKAEELARDFAEGPTFALGMAKKLMDLATGPSLNQYLEIETTLQAQMLQTADHAEGVNAFREKRKARFSGR